MPAEKTNAHAHIHKCSVNMFACVGTCVIACRCEQHTGVTAGAMKASKTRRRQVHALALVLCAAARFLGRVNTAKNGASRKYEKVIR